MQRAVGGVPVHHDGGVPLVHEADEGASLGRFELDEIAIEVEVHRVVALADARIRAALARAVLFGLAKGIVSVGVVDRGDGDDEIFE